MPSASTDHAVHYRNTTLSSRITSFVDYPKRALGDSGFA